MHTKYEWLGEERKTIKLVRYVRCIGCLKTFMRFAALSCLGVIYYDHCFHEDTISIIGIYRNDEIKGQKWTSTSSCISYQTPLWILYRMRLEPRISQNRRHLISLVLATLLAALSVGLSVGPLVGRWLRGASEFRRSALFGCVLASV